MVTSYCTNRSLKARFGYRELHLSTPPRLFFFHIITTPTTRKSPQPSHRGRIQHSYGAIMTTPSAGHRVAHVFELLEQILLHVLEDPVLDGYRLHMSDPKTVVASQRVSTSFRDTIVGSKKVQQALMFTAPVNPTTYGDPYRCNPVIEDFLILGNSWEPLRAPRTRTQNFVRVDALALDSVQSSTEQSWRRMYLSSEPYDVVVWQGFDDVETEFVYMRNVTFGRVYDRALELEEAKKVKDDGADEKREQWA